MVFIAHPRDRVLRQDLVYWCEVVAVDPLDQTIQFGRKEFRVTVKAYSSDLSDIAIQAR